MPAEAYGRDARTDAGPSHLLFRWDESSITMLCVGHVLRTSSISPKKEQLLHERAQQDTLDYVVLLISVILMVTASRGGACLRNGLQERGRVRNHAANLPSTPQSLTPPKVDPSL